MQVSRKRLCKIHYVEMAISGSQDQVVRGGVSECFEGGHGQDESCTLGRLVWQCRGTEVRLRSSLKQGSHWCGQGDGSLPKLAG